MTLSHHADWSDRPLAVIFGCASTTLQAQERIFFTDYPPFGFILFRRNCESPTQIRTLIASLRATCHGHDVSIMIDQEGGRVARLTAPFWPVYPAARCLGRLAERDREQGRRLAWINGRLIAAMLQPLGIDGNCAPVCDLFIRGANEVIGDRALSEDPELVADLAERLCMGMLDGGVLPMIKHIPGHGRTLSDSHYHLPVVETSKEILEETDFIPFRRLAHIPLGMVCHVLYRALDAVWPASVSPLVIGSVIREQIGFTGLLFSDDITMGALSGTSGERAVATLTAGCDIALHGSGVLSDMRDVARLVPRLSQPAYDRWQRARPYISTPTMIDLATMQADFLRSLKG